MINSIATRIPPSPLDDWMAGGLQDWRTERVGSIGRIERKHKPAEMGIAESRGPLEELFGDE